MKKPMKTKECILCGEKYTPRCEKSYFCLPCYLNDYLPNNKVFCIDDFECGSYSLIKKRYYERFWGARPGTEGTVNQEESSNASAKEVTAQSTDKTESDCFRVKCEKSVSPEHAHKRLVDAICSKITYVP